MPARKPTPIGETFHYLTVLGDAELARHYQRRVYAKCICGSEKIYFLRNLVRGLTHSCGCIRGELIHKAFINKRDNQWKIDRDNAIAQIRGFTVVIDAEDYERVSSHRWFVDSKGYCGANGRKRDGIKEPRIALHRFILNAPCDKEVDHVDGNPLNNKKSNLRLATSSQNSMNTSVQKKKRGYKGAVWLKAKKKWRASITKCGKTYFIGHFDTEIEAAQAYDSAAKELFGDYAKLNFN